MFDVSTSLRQVSFIPIFLNTPMQPSHTYDWRKTWNHFGHPLFCGKWLLLFHPVSSALPKKVQQILILRTLSRSSVNSKLPSRSLNSATSVNLKVIVQTPFSCKLQGKKASFIHSFFFAQTAPHHHHRHHRCTMSCYQAIHLRRCHWNSHSFFE